jgi:membrane protein implicated in regulation of membrane protease activity
VSAWIWLVIALVLVLIEVTNFALYAAFLAVGSLAAALTAFLGGGIAAELIVLSGVTLGGLLVARRPLLHALEGRNDRQLVSGAQGMIGQEGVVVERVSGHHPPGLVRARGEDWPAVSYDPEPHEPGEIVTIVDLERTRLVVTNA